MQLIKQRMQMKHCQVQIEEGNPRGDDPDSLVEIDYGYGSKIIIAVSSDDSVAIMSTGNQCSHGSKTKRIHATGNYCINGSNQEHAE